MWAQWRHVANMIEFVLPSANPSQQSKHKSIGSAVFAQLAAKSPYTLQSATLSPKIAPSHGGSGPPSNTWFLGPIRAHNPNGISICSAVFAHLTAECPYILQWAAPFKIVHSPSTNGSLGPLEPEPKLDRFNRFCMGWHTDRPTEHATRSITVGRIYVHSKLILRCGII